MSVDAPRPPTPVPSAPGLSPPAILSHVHAPSLARPGLPGVRYVAQSLAPHRVCLVSVEGIPNLPQPPLHTAAPAPKMPGLQPAPRDPWGSPFSCPGSLGPELLSRSLASLPPTAPLSPALGAGTGGGSHRSYAPQCRGAPAYAPSPLKNPGPQSGAWPKVRPPPPFRKHSSAPILPGFKSYLCHFLCHLGHFHASVSPSVK